ncbi:HNH endonuclease [Pseudomonas nitroreducens]|uniref:HNH endonuclease n=1 Tax=Pseudomonas nitroreducens TaxID=46680 RepID=UPI001FB6889C|nr:HNH endonuclease [Pseudomonas nitroreducens]MCJ1879618.1 HNH endonuclease [Pseudomonas nitroreducens]MCJ1896779.1 HNH endonuclease [Pseudomonas nitroreducens]
MKLSAIRTRAFSRQQGRCYYCGCPMWQTNPDLFAQSHGVTRRQARAFQCTAEHLLARQDGGKDSLENIAAACLECNRRRHKRIYDMSAQAYLAHVRNRMDRGRWHSCELS